MTDEQETSHAFARSRSNAGLGKRLANMDFGFGNTNSWLEIMEYEDMIVFYRDQDGVHAWHCGSLVDDVTALTVLPVDGDYGKGGDALRNWMTIRKGELSALLENRNLPVPAFLRLFKDAPQTAHTIKIETVREAGRYTLEEATCFVTSNAKARVENILEKLMRDVESGALPAYEPGMMERYRFGAGKVVRVFYEEVYWNDLNEWLEKNESRLDCEFPNPTASAVLVETAKRSIISFNQSLAG